MIIEPAPPNNASPERLSAFHVEMNDRRRSWKALLSILTSSAISPVIKMTAQIDEVSEGMKDGKGAEGRNLIPGAFIVVLHPA